MLDNNSSNNRRIAKNTIFLYFRMLAGLLVSLYTAKVTLNVLGAEDFGLNNVVAGVLSLFSFLTGSLYAATSRFLTYDLGKGDRGQMRTTFINASTLHTILAFIIVFCGETIGVYLIQNVLVIPPERMWACHVLFQTVIVSTFFTVAMIPYGGLVIAFEKMDVYAYIGLFDIFARLGVVFMLQWSPSDKLITIGVLGMCVSLIQSLFYFVYCKRSFADVFAFRFKIEKQFTKKILGFSAWNLIGAIAYMLRFQGVNMLLNVFFGPVVNAANAIAYRINSAVSGFVTNFTTASNPQIIKDYASGEYEAMKNLIYRAGKFTFFMLMILSFPIIFEVDFILHIWLGSDVPEFTGIMTRLVLIIAMVETFTYSIGCGINATGNVKWYQIIICSIMMLIFPLAWLAFKLGFPPYFGLVVYLCTSIAALASRMYFIKKQLYINPYDYAKNVFLPAVMSAVVSLIIPIIFYQYLSESWSRFVIMAVVVETCNIASIWFIGMNKTERTFVTNLISKKLLKR